MSPPISRSVQSLAQAAIAGRPGAGGWRLSFSPAELERTLRDYFPLEKGVAVGRWVFNHPGVSIDASGARLLVALDAGWWYRERCLLRLHGNLSGHFRYDPALATLFLCDLRLENLSVPDLNHLPVGILVRPLQVPLRFMLEEIPLLRLRGDGLGSRLARSMLREVSVRDGKLWVELGVGPRPA